MALKYCGRLLRSFCPLVSPEQSIVLHINLSLHTHNHNQHPFNDRVTDAHDRSSAGSFCAYSNQSRSFRSSSILQKSIEVEIQSMGESISEGTIAEILKAEGDAVEEDETIAQIETDKVTVDVRAPAAGKLTELRMSVEDTVKVGQVVAIVSEGSEGGREKSSSTEPSQKQAHEKHTGAQDSEAEAKDKEGPSDEPPGRKPSIQFPQRMVNGKRVSDLPESERPGQSHSEGQPEKQQEKKADSHRTPQPKKSQPWYVGKEQGTKLSQSRVLTQREMEQIELGGAEP